jgi:hypothetical protein
MLGSGDGGGKGGAYPSVPLGPKQHWVGVWSETAWLVVWLACATMSHPSDGALIDGGVRVGGHHMKRQQHTADGSGCASKPAALGQSKGQSVAQLRDPRSPLPGGQWQRGCWQADVAALPPPAVLPSHPCTNMLAAAATPDPCWQAGYVGYSEHGRPGLAGSRAVPECA